MSRASLAPIARAAWRPIAQVVVLIAPLAVLLLLRAIVWTPIGRNPDHVDNYAVGKCLDKGNKIVACGDRAAAYKLVVEVDSDHDCPGETADTWAAPGRAMGGPDRVYCGVALKGPDVPFAVGKCVDESYEQVVDCGSEQAHFKLVSKAHSEADCADTVSEEDWGGTTIWYCVRPLRRGARQSAR
jgi:hypothetical protein